MALAGKLVASIASPMQVAGQRLSLPASLGLAVSPDDGSCVDTLLASADAAMYRAKRLRQAPHGTERPALPELERPTPEEAPANEHRKR